MKRILILTIACGTAAGAHGQLFDTSAAQSELVATLMGTGRVFTANVTVKREKGDKQIKIADNIMFMRDGNLRIEHKPADEPALAELTAKLKKDNLAEVVTILLPKENKAYLLLPGKRAYLDAPADGHSCAVRQLTVISTDESRQQITIWEATDLEGFIVKSVMDRGDDTNEALYFSNIRREKPDDAKFAVPAGYAKLKPEAAAQIATTMMEFDLDRDAALADVLR